jgi:hypothetical protein
MRPGFLVLALCVTCWAEGSQGVEVVVPPSAAHPQDWLRLQIRDHPKPDDSGKPAGSFAEFLAPEVISKIAVDQYAGPSDDVRHYLSELPTAAAKYLGPSPVFCKPGPGTSTIAISWTSSSTVTFESGRSGRLAVAMVHPMGGGHFAVPTATPTPGCLGPDQVPYDGLYVRYVDPDGYSWYFAVRPGRGK